MLIYEESSSEYQIVQYMRVIDRQVFLLLICHTNQETGVIGDDNLMSYQRISSKISETMTPGRRTPLIKFSVSDVKKSIRDLIKVGVLKDIGCKSNNGCLKLIRPYFVRDFCNLSVD
jgi:hypothetical protein